MIFEQLKARGLVEVVDPDLPGANRLMARAQKDLKTAQAVVGTDAEWAYVVAVHAVLRAARALMLAEGFRPRGRDQTRTLLQIAGSLVGEGEGSTLDDLEQVRKKGQHFLEWADRPISLYELEATLNIAEQWVGVVAKRVYAKDPQARLL
ncbi:MAG: HEPN domain-containing protein [Candidatus Methylomirabilales bacterium]